MINMVGLKRIRILIYRINLLFAELSKLELPFHIEKEISEIHKEINKL